jgi:hypothetical protein
VILVEPEPLDHPGRVGVIISFSSTIGWPSIGSWMAFRLTRPRIASNRGRSTSSPLY